MAWYILAGIAGLIIWITVSGIIASFFMRRWNRNERDEHENHEFRGN